MNQEHLSASELRARYYDTVLDLYFNKGMGYNRISRIIPMSKSGIKKWVVTFAKENGRITSKEIMKAKTQEKREDDVDALKSRIAELEAKLKYQEMRADAYDTMIDIAEKKFCISIRKKAGAKR